MKDHQLTILSKAIKFFFVAGGSIFNPTLAITAYAACPTDNIKGFIVSSGTCDANRSEYIADNTLDYIFLVMNGSTLNIKEQNVNIIKNNIPGNVIQAYHSTVNVDHNIDIHLVATSDGTAAINSDTGSNINLNGTTTIYHDGPAGKAGSGLAAQVTNNQNVASKITAKGLVKIETTGAVGIIALDKSIIDLEKIDITIGNNGNKRNLGLYSTKSSNIFYTSGKITSSGSALKAENGGVITSTSIQAPELKFIKILNINNIPSGIPVEKINIIVDGTKNILSSPSSTSTEITVLKNNSDVSYFTTTDYEEISIADTYITTSNAEAHALYATGNNSKILLAGSLIAETKGNHTSSLYAENGGNIIIQSATDLIISGTNSTGLTATGANSNILLKQPTTLTFSSTSGTAINNSNNAVITLLGNVASTGDETAINNNSNATINFFGSQSTFAGNAFNNNATISLANGVLGGKLKIGGTYTGNNGLLVLDTDLADDNSQTDFVEIGGQADGVTKVDIKSGNSQGAPTKNGIKVIQTQSSKEGVFVLAGTKGYITAGGIYDYYLEYREKNTSKNTTNYDNWYLMNYDYKEEDHIYAPDIGEYLATETMGNTLFTSRLEDREGASQYQGLGNKDIGNVWVRAYGGHNQFKTMNSQLKTTGNSFVTQIGAGLVTLGEEDQYNLGAMSGFAYYDGKTRSDITTRESKTKIEGYSLGLYGTWYAHPVEQRGTYIDSWVLWNKFNNSIDTPDQNKYKFNSSGVTASIEVGGDYLINKNGKKNWWVQPQSQIIYQGVHTENFQDAQGVDVYHGKDNVQMRMGVKTYLDIPTSGNKFTSYRPYVALNYIQNTNPYSVVINDERYENEGSEKQGEIKFGIEGNTTKNSQVWLNASYATGSHNNEAYQGNIGWKYNF